MDYPTKVTINLKGDNSSYRFSDIVYEEFVLRMEDPVIAGLVQAAKEEFKGSLEKITVTAKIVYE